MSAKEDYSSPEYKLRQMIERGWINQEDVNLIRRLARKAYKDRIRYTATVKP